MFTFATSALNPEGVRFDRFTERIFPTQVRALNPRTLPAEVTRRMPLNSRQIRLLTSAATNGRFRGGQGEVPIFFNHG